MIVKVSVASIVGPIEATNGVVNDSKIECSLYSEGL